MWGTDTTKKDRARKAVTATLLSVLLFYSLVSFGIFIPRPAQAICGEPTSVSTGPQGIPAPDVLKVVGSCIKEFVGGALTTAVFNALNRVAQKVAYDTAVWIASGAAGEEPLVFQEGFGNYLKNTALDGVADIIGGLSGPWEELGFNLCSPSLPTISAKIQLGIAGTYQPQPPKCSWQQLRRNYSAFSESVSSGEFLQGVGSMFEFGGSDLSAAFQIGAKTEEIKLNKERDALLERLEGRGFKSKKDPITGAVQTPAAVVEEKTQDALKKGDKAEEAQLFGVFANTDKLLAAGGNILGIFVNTLASQLLEKVFTGLLHFPAPAPRDLFSLEGSEPRGRAAAREVYADILTPRVIELSGFNFLSELGACPQIGARRSWNCVMDAGFVAALSQGGELVTVREALDNGFLQKDWPLISPQDAAKNQDPFCFSSSYCYGNLLKLRRVRIIPIGWELAAASSKNSVATPVRLGEVVDGFNDCDPTTGGVTPEHPWCHLIDPNWILKIPQTQCRMRVAGATLISNEIATRAEECVDTPSCIAEEKDGSCKSGYGYCTRERNIWRFPGDSCPEQFSSCMTVTKRGGGESSFLLNTVTFSATNTSVGCNSNNAGCNWYAATRGGNGEWVATSTRRYFDREVASCEARDAGCAALLPNVSGLLRQNLLTNSSFENGPDATPALPNGWAQSDTRLALPTYDRSGTEAFHGTDAVRTTSGLQQAVTYQPGKTYTISVYARQTTAGADMDVSIMPLLSSGIDQTTLATTCTIATGGALSLRFTPGTSYTRAECSFTTASTGGPFSATFQISQPIAGGEIWLDAVQLNEGSSAGSYIETAGYTSTAARYLRRAPDYLHCEQNPTSSACASYAAACFADEVGCERYSPTSGDPAVPAVAAPEFSCPSECAGYADFRQEPTNFEAAKYPVFLVPGAARTCDASSAGCDEFTNEDTEARETFTFLRACIKSPSSDEATYYTWVGSETTGFQLEAHRLKKGTPLPFDWDSDPLTPATTESSLNPPAYVAGFEDYGRCTAVTYGSLPGDPNFDADCKQFYDVAGEISYRLRAKTIVATPDCHPYRATLSTGDDCTATGGSWDTSRGECTFLGFPGESTRCSAAAKSCRAYTGSAGRNVRVVFADGFESGLSGWEGGVLSTESTSAGGKSLKATSGGALTKDVSPQSATAIQKGRTYLLTFWAKGTGSPIVKFTSDQTDQINRFTDDDLASPRTTITLTPAWQLFSVGPVRVTWEPDPRDPASSDPVFEQLRFENFSTDAFFDNVILREVAENIYLLKDSATVPTACDQTREGAPLPQAMLGCTEYRDRAGAVSYYTGFDHICREAAVGCKSFIDTFATPEITAKSYCANPPCVASAPDTITAPADKEVFLVDDSSKACSAEKVGCERIAKPISGTCVLSAACTGSACDCSVKTTNGLTETVNDQVVCQVAQGKRMCAYNIPAYTAPTFGGVARQISGATCGMVSSCTTPAGCDCQIDQKSVCKVASGGTTCAFSGITYEEKVVRNDPGSYGASLCADAQVGCEEWTREDAGISYFKAPAGQTCEYKENADTATGKKSGWFRSGFIVPVPCDPQYVVGGVLAGIWRNADLNYRGWAGTCSAAFSGCTEFRDPLDISAQYPSGRSYYALKNDRLNQGNDCNGQVSDKEGCALFQDTSLPLLGVASSTFHAGATALKSTQADFAPVSPVDCAKTPRAVECQKQCASGVEFSGRACETAADCGGVYPSCESVPMTSNNANTVLEVKRDRVCGEWLACRSSFSAWDASAGRFREVCDQIGLCVKYQKVGQSLQCIEWSDRPATPLDIATYASRDRSFAGFEYSGYSIPGLLPPEKLTQVDVLPGSESDFRLAYAYCSNRCATTTSQPCTTISPSSADCPFIDATEGTREACGASLNCNAATPDLTDCASTASEGAACGLGPGAAGKGRCVNKKCLYTLTGGAVASDPTASLPGQACRAYPEQDSPFPREVLANDADNLNVRAANAVRLPGFARANVCEEGDLACECNYQKVAYGDQAVGGTVLYYGPGSASMPQGICQGGPRGGESCNPDAPADNFDDTDDCGPSDGGGKCLVRRRQDQVLGFKGYCLEEDLSVAVNGNRNKRNCLTWLPVDQLLGTADLYNQNTAAGFQSGELFYCPLTDEYTTLWAKAGSVEDHGGGSRCPASEDYFADHSKIFDGAYRDVPCRFSPDYDVVFAVSCLEGDVKDEWNNLGPDRFYAGELKLGHVPFICLPKGSYHSGRLPSGQELRDAKIGQACNLDIVGRLSGPITPWPPYDTGPTVTVYEIGGTVAEQNATLKALKDCRRDGVEASIWQGTEEPDGILGEDVTGGHVQPDRIEQKQKVLGCTYVSKVGSLGGAQPNVAWTDRVWAQKPQPYTIVTTEPELSYSFPSPEAPFGRAGSPEIAPPYSFLFSPTCAYPEGALAYPSDPNNPSVCPVAEGSTSMPLNISNDGRSYGRADDGEDISVGLGRLKQLFAKAIGVWQWFDGTETVVPSGTAEPARYLGKYDPISVTSASPTVTEVGDASKQPRPPVIKAVGACSGGRCQEGAAGQVTVNGQSSGNIVANGRLRVTLQFFGYADADQMPVKLVAVDWGDGTISGSTEPINFYKNHRGIKSSGSSECDSSNFGTSPAACEDTGPFSFTHEYFPTCANPNAADSYCHYTPRIILRDNWGWCNGACPSPSRPNGGCYSGGAGGAQCDVFSGGALRGTLYDGELIVAPGQ